MAGVQGETTREEKPAQSGCLTLQRVLINTREETSDARKEPPEHIRGDNPRTHAALNNSWDIGQKGCICLSSGAKLALD